MPSDADPGIPGWFIAVAVIIVLLGIGTTVWRVMAARSIARSAGLDPRQATKITLLGDDGLDATYLAATIGVRDAHAAGQQRALTTERLRELDDLRRQGLVSDAEFAEQRARILDSL